MSRLKALWVNGIVPGLVIAVATFVVYFGVWENAYQLDDMPNIVTQPNIRMKDLSAQALANAFQGGHMPQRPVANVTLALDWYRGEGRPAVFLSTNLVIHLANILLVFALLRHILSAHAAMEARTSIALALLGALAWGLHPVQVSGVSYIVQRMTSLSGTFIFAALLAYLKFRHQGRIALLAVAVMAALLGGMTKEIAWLIPAYVVLVELTLLNRKGIFEGAKNRVLVILVALGTAYVVVDLSVGGWLYQFVQPGYELRSFSLAERLWTQPRVIALYLQQVFTPHLGLFSIEHEIVPSRSLTQPPTTLVAALLVLVWLGAGALLAAVRSARVFAFFLLFPLVALSMESSIVSLELMFEHRMYVPLFGIAGLLVLGVGMLVHRYRLHLAGAVLVVSLPLIVWPAYVTSAYLEKWRSQRSLYEHAVESSPDSHRAWELLANALERSGQDGEAIAAYTRSLSLGNPSWRVRSDRGQLLLKAGDLVGAKQDLDAAIELNPITSAPYANRAVVYFMRGDYRAALADLDRAIGIKPYFSEALHNRALIKFRMGDLEGAARDAQAAVRFGGNDDRYRRLLAEIVAALRAR